MATGVLEPSSHFGYQTRTGLGSPPRGESLNNRGAVKHCLWNRSHRRADYHPFMPKQVPASVNRTWTLEL